MVEGIPNYQNYNFNCRAANGGIFISDWKMNICTRFWVGARWVDTTEKWRFGKYAECAPAFHLILIIFSVGIRIQGRRLPLDTGVEDSVTSWRNAHVSLSYALFLCVFRICCCHYFRSLLKKKVWKIIYVLLKNKIGNFLSPYNASSQLLARFALSLNPYARDDMQVFVPGGEYCKPFRVQGIWFNRIRLNYSGALWSSRACRMRLLLLGKEWRIVFQKIIWIDFFF